MLRLSPRKILCVLVTVGTGSLLLLALSSPSFNASVDAAISTLEGNPSYRERQVDLPPEPVRCPVYTFHDSETKNAAEENEVIAVWKKAFWAAGFKPIVLSPEDSQNHILYSVLAEKFGRKRPPEAYLRWLAWASAGNGLFADWTVIPFIRQARNPTLPWLRQCSFDSLYRFGSLGTSLLAGSQPDIDTMLTDMIATNQTDVNDINSLAEETLTLRPTPSDVVNYSPSLLEEKYQNISTSQLADLINAHLHQSLLLSYPKGIAVVDPVPDVTHILSFPALRLARRLARCPKSPLQDTHSPLHAKAPPCDSIKHEIKLQKSVTNSTSQLNFVTIPHPMTYLWLSQQHSSVDANIVRDSKRNPWLGCATAELTPAGVSARKRGSVLKEAIIDRNGHTIANIWEESWNENDVSWILGFTLPPLSFEDDDLEAEGNHKYVNNVTLLSEAKKAVQSWEAKFMRERLYIEAWSMGDTGIWRFVKDWSARNSMARIAWSG